MRKIFIFLMVVLPLIFLSVLKVDANTNETNSDIDYTIYGHVIDGIYYNSSRKSYMWVMSIDIPWSTPVKITTDFDGMLYFFDKYLGEYNDDGDIVYINPEGTYFNTWWQDSIYIDKLVSSGYFFYEITGGIAIPPIENVLKVELDFIVPIYPINRLDNIISVLELIDDITYEELLQEYNRGFDNGYNSGYDLGYYEGYNVGYDKGISENLETGGFGLILKNVFLGVGSFLGIQLLPGISIGAIIAVPIVFGIISFILGRRKE